MSNECTSLPMRGVVLIDDNFCEAINYAVRYALGRRTYAASSMAKYVESLVPGLNDLTLRVLETDIASKRDLGDSWDEEAWSRLLTIIRKERRDRRTKAGDRRA